MLFTHIYTCMDKQLWGLTFFHRESDIHIYVGRERVTTAWYTLYIIYIYIRKKPAVTVAMEEQEEEEEEEGVSVWIEKGCWSSFSFFFSPFAFCCCCCCRFHCFTSCFDCLSFQSEDGARRTRMMCVCGWDRMTRKVGLSMKEAVSFFSIAEE